MFLWLGFICSFIFISKRALLLKSSKDSLHHFPKSIIFSLQFFFKGWIIYYLMHWNCTLLMETLPGDALKLYPKNPRALSTLCDGHCECPTVTISWQVILTWELLPLRFEPSVLGVLGLSRVCLQNWFDCLTHCFRTGKESLQKTTLSSDVRPAPSDSLCLFWLLPSSLFILSLCFPAQQPRRQLLLSSYFCMHPHFSSMTKVPLPMLALCLPRARFFHNSIVFSSDKPFSSVYSVLYFPILVYH